MYATAHVIASRLAIIGDLITNIGQNVVEQTAATLRMCTNVQEFTWFGCNMTNEQLAPIVSVLENTVVWRSLFYPTTELEMLVVKHLLH